MTRLVVRLVLSSILVASLRTHAQTPAPLPADGSFAADGRMAYFPDSSGRLKLADVMQSSLRFRTMQAAIPQFGKGNPPCWFRSVVANPASVAQSFVAEIDYSFLDDVQFFLVDSQNRLIAQSKSIGWSSPLAERPDQHRNVLFHFALPAHQSHQLYVRVFARANRLSAPLRIWTAGAFSLHDRADRT